MVTESNTVRHLIKTIIGVIILTLAITMFIQHRRIIALTREANGIYLQEEVGKYKAEIKALESQITDLQAKQDYGLVPQKNSNTASKAEVQERPGENMVADNSPLNKMPDFMNNPNMRNNLRRSISGRYDAFTEENDLSEETISKLYDLLAEMRMEMMNRFPRPGRGGFSPEMMDSEGFRQQIEELKGLIMMEN